MPIAKAVFHEISERANYDGKYQNQENEPVKARFEQELV
jgi:deoxycytidine triphosphate deaminase